MSLSKRCLSSLLIGSVGLLAATGSHAYDTGDWIVRVGPTLVSPDDSSDSVLGGTLGVESGTSLGFSGTYMTSPQMGIEVLAALPFTHDIVGADGLSSVGKLAETKHLPPTVTAQYYFMPDNPDLQVYAGLGVNYTIFFDESTTSTLTSALSAASTEVKLDASLGLAAELGADIKVADTFSINASLWYIDIDTEAEVIADGATVTTLDVSIDPWVFMLGAAFKF